MQDQDWDTIENFKVSKKLSLGRGQSCQVYYGFNEKTGEKVAAKKIDIRTTTPGLQKQLENQITNLKKLTSPFIVRMYDYLRSGNFLYIFLEYCDDTDLKRYLQKNRKKNNVVYEAEALMFMRHIIEGYKDLKKNNIIHRDIKPANILLKQGIAKLSDFGFSRVIPASDHSDKFTLLGTPMYTAPEILGRGKFSSKCDVWSMGIVFYEMLYGRTPWTAQTIPELQQNILNKPLQFDSQIKRKDQIKELIRKMLTVNTEDRIGWNQIFAFPLFQDQLPKINTDPKGYEEIKKIFIEYVKTNIVKSYLRFNMKEVDFKEVMEPDSKQSEFINQIHHKISHKRNIAFFFAYILVLYFKNVEIFPPNFNKNMELQYSLAMKAFFIVSGVGTNYFSKEPTQYSKEQWKIFKQSAAYEELKKVLTADFKIIQKIMEYMKKEAEKRYKEGKITKDVVKWFELIEKSKEGFPEAMKVNLKVLISTNKKGILGLLAYYIQLTESSKQLEENQFFDFGSFYEKQERVYGLD